MITSAYEFDIPFIDLFHFISQKTAKKKKLLTIEDSDDDDDFDVDDDDDSDFDM